MKGYRTQTTLAEYLSRVRARGERRSRSNAKGKERRMTDEVVLTEAEVAAQALRVQALCVLIAWMGIERGDRIGVWSREIAETLGSDIEVVTEARRISFKEGH